MSTFTSGHESTASLLEIRWETPGGLEEADVIEAGLS